MDHYREESLFDSVHTQIVLYAHMLTKNIASGLMRGSPGGNRFRKNAFYNVCWRTDDVCRGA